MIKRKLVSCIFLFSSLCAFGQVAPDATERAVPLTVGGSFSFFDASYASNKISGFGTYVDWSPLLMGNLGVEAEGRWMTFGGSHGLSESNYLVGPRYRFSFSDRFQPYAKFMIGAGEIKFPYDLAHGGYLVMAPGGGMDYVISRHWRLRADYEFQIWQNAFGFPDVPSGSVHPNGVSAGVSYRLF